MFRTRILPSHRVITSEDLMDFIAHVMTKEPVMGPMERPDQPGFHVFDWLVRPGDLVLDYTTTTLPPKKAFFPPKETLFRFEKGDPPELSPVKMSGRFVVLGIHPCDLSAIDALDKAYTYPPPDRRWQHNRSRALLIGVDCVPDSYCFCDSLGAANARKPCDLFLTRVGRGYLVEIHTQAGAEFMAQARTTDPKSKDFTDAQHWRENKVRSLKGRLQAGPDRLADFLETESFQEIWEDIASRRYSRGSCNTTCPACFCFTTTDEFDWDLKSGVRYRAWDACQLQDFDIIAGGHHFREKRWQRVRHRWHRKFLYLYRRFGRPFCTGCGRCSRACTADINMLDETNRIIIEATAGETHV